VGSIPLGIQKSGILVLIGTSFAHNTTSGRSATVKNCLLSNKGTKMKVLFACVLFIFFAPAQSFLPGLHTCIATTNIRLRSSECVTLRPMTSEGSEFPRDEVASIEGSLDSVLPEKSGGRSSGPHHMRSIIVSPEKMVAPGEKR
jgi:hypothetical protein